VDIDLEHLKSSLEAKRVGETKEAFHELFGARGTNCDLLFTNLKPTAFMELCTTLWHIRRAPLHLRPTLALAIPLILANDEPSAHMRAQMLAIAKGIIERFPEHVDQSPR
jgi:hypothetical protein